MSNLDYYQYKAAVYDTLFTGTVYGAYIVFYVTSAYILLSKPGFTSSRPRMIMFGITSFMFALGIITLVLETTVEFQYILLNSDPLKLAIISTVWATITRLMYILNDIICAWRTVVLWSKDKHVIAILLLFILGTTVAAACDVYFTVAPLFGQTNLSIEYPSKIGQRALIMVSPTLATNLLSTGLIAWKAWQRRILVREHLYEGSGFLRVNRLIALPIESGVIYCFIWIVYVISSFVASIDPGFTTMAFVSGLYPTLIIILVSMQMSPVEHYSTHSTRMQFTRGPPFGSPRAGSMRPHVPMIYREHAKDFDTQMPCTEFMKSSDEENRSLH